jgi:hypothetical protein
MCLSSQVNDDTIIETPNWAPRLIAALEKNPHLSNFGVTGPTDSNNDKIFTHSFVHRTHIDVSDSKIFWIIIIDDSDNRYLDICFPLPSRTGGPMIGFPPCMDHYTLLNAQM